MPMNLGLGLGLSRRGGGGGPPLILGNSNTIVSGGVTWTLSAAVDWGRTEDGVAWIIVPPGGVNVTGRTPAATTESALPVNGTVKNPQRQSAGAEKQGWHGGISTYDALLNASFPISVVAGDIIVGAIFAPGAAATNPRLGVNASYSGLICTSGGYPANTFAPSLTGWTGRGTPQAYQLDVDAAVATLPSYSLSGISHPTVANTIAQIDRLEIGAGYSEDALGVIGYETLLTNGLGSPDTNYGRWVGRWIGAAGLHMIGNVASTAQKKTILTAMIRHGIQWYDPVAGKGVPVIANGGHFQFSFMPIATALKFLNRASALDTLRTVLQANELGQTFIYTAGLVADLSPHSDVTKPMVSRRRAITAVSGNNITFQTARPGDSARANFVGLELVRESDGASALITAMRANTTIAGTDDATLLGTGSDTKGFTINAQPTPPFSVADVTYMRRPETIYVGEADWRVDNFDYTILPSHTQEYRDINRFSDDLLTVRALGVWRDDWAALEHYVAKANRSSDPSAPRDYPTHHDTVDGFSFAQGFWNAHAQSILGSYPVIITNVAISGTAELGTVLTAIPATAAPVSGLTRAYQWYKDGVAIPGAIGTTYTVQAGDVGSRLAVWETITNGQGTQISRSSAITAIPVYSVNAVNLNGSTSAISTSVSGSPATTQGAAVFSFRYASAFGLGAIANLAQAGGVRSMYIETALNLTGTPPTTEGRIAITLRNASNAIIGSMVTANGEFLAGTGYTVAVSFDTVTQTWVVRKRAYGGSWVTVTPATATLTLNAQVGAVGRCAIGTSNGTADRPTNLDLADVWLGLGQLPNFTDAAVLARFLPTVSKGADGSLPTGIAPEFYFSGDTPTWHVNDGTGGGLTLTGPLTTATVQPT